MSGKAKPLMFEEITREEAVRLCESGWWKDRSASEIAHFQLFVSRLCVPNFGIFHEAVEKVLGRPVWTHEFIDTARLQAELLGSAPKPTFREILELIPEAKRIVVAVDNDAVGGAKP